MELAAQFDLLAQGRNLEDWGDFLVIAIMAVLWLAGALAKAIGGRKGTQPPQQQDTAKQRRQKETWQERLARKAAEMQRAAQTQAREMQQGPRTQAETARRQPASPPPAGRIRVRTAQKGDSLIVFERPPSEAAERQQHAARQRDARTAVAAAGQQAAKTPSVEPRIQTTGPGSEPIIGGMVSTMREPPRSLEPGIATSYTTREPAGFQPLSLIDYSDPEALKKAILHYEILGKPLALRDSTEEASSF